MSIFNHIEAFTFDMIVWLTVNSKFTIPNFMLAIIAKRIELMLSNM